VTIYRVAVTAALLAGVMGCKSKERVTVQTEEEAPRLATMLATNDPRAAAQLLSGFHGLEGNAWRWTAGHFAVMLRPPLGAGQSGAVLKLQFAIPSAVIDKVKTMTLSATVGGVKLDPETYTKAGDYTYTRDVPAAALPGDAAKVEFAFDKFLAAGSVETRELAAIATSVGFEHK
jgi:hypothetical protein